MSSNDIMQSVEEYSSTDGWTTVQRNNNIKTNDKGYDKGSSKGSSKESSKGFGKSYDKGSSKGYDKGSGKGYDKGYGKGKETIHPELEKFGKVWLKTNIIRLKSTDTKINGKIHSYIKTLSTVLSNENEIIRMTKAIGHSENDKLICLANLFFICVRRDRTSLMQRIVDSLSKDNIKEELNFIVNGNDLNYTPIMRAAYHGSVNSIKLLLPWGSDINFINCDGEDIVSATEAGLRDTLLANQKNGNLNFAEIFDVQRYHDIKEYINFWNENKNNPDREELFFDLITKDETFDETKDDTTNETKKKYNILNTNENLSEQIETKLQDYIENSNIQKMTDLFLDINELIKDNLIDKIDINQIIEQYREILMDEYDNEFKVLEL